MKPTAEAFLPLGGARLPGSDERRDDERGNTKKREKQYSFSP